MLIILAVIVLPTSIKLPYEVLNSCGNAPRGIPHIKGSRALQSCATGDPYTVVSALHRCCIRYENATFHFFLTRYPLQCHTQYIFTVITVSTHESTAQCDRSSIYGMAYNTARPGTARVKVRITVGVRVSMGIGLWLWLLWLGIGLGLA